MKRFIGNHFGNYTERGRLKFSMKKWLMVMFGYFCLFWPAVWWPVYSGELDGESLTAAYTVTLTYYGGLLAAITTVYFGAKVQYNRRRKHWD